MKRFLICSLVALLALPVSGQQRIRLRGVSSQQQGGGGLDTSILSTARKYDWTRAGVTDGITHRSTQCGSTIAAYTGTAATINTAISNCTEGQFVQLGAGTFTLSTAITFGTKNNVTLRGAGAGSTTLDINGSTTCGFTTRICVSANTIANAESPQNSTNITGGYTHGSTTITVQSATGLSVGHIVYMDQQNDSAGSDTGNVWFIEWGGTGGGRLGSPNRMPNQVNRVCGLSGTTVTLCDPIAGGYWRSARDPELWWAGAPRLGIGIEDLTIDCGWTSETDQTCIMFAGVYNSWIARVATIQGGRSHINMFESARNTVRDNYMHLTADAAQQSYGVEMYVASNILVENMMADHVTAPVSVNSACAGCVIAYIHTRENTYTPSADWQQPCSTQHSAGSAFLLYEGNDCNALQGDWVHGTHALGTYIRNFLYGRDSGKSQQTNPFGFPSVNRYHNILGNVLGDDTYHSAYAGASNDEAIYRIGEGDSEAPTDTTKSTATMFRWANYDTVNDAVRCQSSEVPSADGDYPNSVPGSCAVPNSLYLASKPAFFGSRPWPGVGPEVTGGDISGYGGRAYKNPARLCYENSTKNGDGEITSYHANCAIIGGTP